MLDLTGIRARVQRNVIVFATDLHLPVGGAIGLQGANGSGKSTLLGVISGHVDATAGGQRYRGADISNWSRHRRARNGILRSFQDPRPFRSLTVAQTAKAHRCTPAQFSELLEFLAPGIEPRTPVRTLSVGQTKLVELAALLSTPKDVLLLDEPLAGLDAGARRRVGEALRSRRHQETMLIVEHDTRLLHDVCDEVVTIDSRVEAP